MDLENTTIPSSRPKKRRASRYGGRLIWTKTERARGGPTAVGACDITLRSAELVRKPQGADEFNRFPFCYVPINLKHQHPPPPGNPRAFDTSPFPGSGAWQIPQNVGNMRTAFSWSHARRAMWKCGAILERYLFCNRLRKNGLEKQTDTLKGQCMNISLCRKRDRVCGNCVWKSIDGHAETVYKWIHTSIIKTSSAYSIDLMRSFLPFFWNFDRTTRRTVRSA